MKWFGFHLRKPLAQSLHQLSHEEIEAIHPIPIALILGDVLIELLNQNHEIEEILLRIDGWRRADGEGFHEKIETTGIKGDLLFSNLPKLLDLNIN